MINVPQNPSTLDHIGDVFKSPPWAECYDSIFENEKIAKSITLSTPFERSLLPPGTKILCSRI